MFKSLKNTLAEFSKNEKNDMNEDAFKNLLDPSLYSKKSTEKIYPIYQEIPKDYQKIKGKRLSVDYWGDNCWTEIKYLKNRHWDEYEKDIIKLLVCVDDFAQSYFLIFGDNDDFKKPPTRNKFIEKLLKMSPNSVIQEETKIFSEKAFKKNSNENLKKIIYEKLNRKQKIKITLIYETTYSDLTAKLYKIE